LPPNLGGKSGKYQDSRKNPMPNLKLFTFKQPGYLRKKVNA